MSTILVPNKLKQEFARSMYRDIINENDVFYIFFGHTEAWGNGDTPPSLTDTRANDADVHKNIIAVKRVEKTDVTLMVPNVTWVSGRNYDRYDDRVDLATLVRDYGSGSIPSFFVYNANNKCIYKCVNHDAHINGIYNPNVNYPSTVVPANTTPEKFRTSDGYWWKLMYFVSSALEERFLNSQFIPVSFTASSGMFDVSGIISSIDVVSSGEGYTVPPLVIINGDGIGASARAFINLYGEVTSIEVVNQGRGYSYATIDIVDPTTNPLGVGCTASATLGSDSTPETINTEVASKAQESAGAIEFVDLIIGGENYTDQTIFSVVGDGTNAYVQPTIVGKAVYSIEIPEGNGGKGYTFASIETVGKGENAVFHPIISPVYGHGGNVPAELLATTVGISVEIDSNFSDFFLGNDFRQIGLLKNVREFGVYGNVFTQKTGDASYNVVVIDYNAYNLDDIIKSDDGGEFIVIQKLPATNTIKLLPFSGQLSLTSVLTNYTTSANLSTLQTVVEPEINTKTGDVVYMRNTTPYMRQYQQNETVKLYLQF